MILIAVTDMIGNIQRERGKEIVIGIGLELQNIGKMRKKEVLINANRPKR